MKFNLESDNLLDVVKYAEFDELDCLCEQIRDFLISKVSTTGGHLASNLGIVELTVALHRVYNSPKDKIIFDVGHQAYVHKILTGRAREFDTLRQYNGLSGFPKKRESKHDVYDTGHSSTSVSAAHGMAVARDIKGETGEIVAVIGDGSMTGGIVFEALNNIGAAKENVKIILNDNGMSISHNVGSMSKHLMHLRTSSKYLGAKSQINAALETVPVVGTKLKAGISHTKERIKQSIITEEAALFESLGIKYIGPVDGHNIAELTEAIEASNKIDGPTILHVITTKGMGYKYAESNPSKFHGIGAFNVNNGNILSSSNEPSFSAVFGKTLADLAADNKRVTAISAAMCDATGLGPFSKIYPDRFFDVGIAESHAVVFAAGLASNGMVPVVAIYSSFLQRSFDYIIEDVCLQNLHVVFAIDRAGLVGADGETHHGVFDLSYLSMIPNIEIFTPANGKQLSEILDYAVNKADGPVAIRYPRGSSVLKSGVKLPQFTGAMHDADSVNNVICEGRDVIILAAGGMLDQAVNVADSLETQGISAGIVNVCRVKPFDLPCEIDTKLVVTLEDNVYRGGFGEFFSAVNKDSSFDILSYALPDRFIEHGTIGQLRAECGVDEESVVKGVVSYFEGKTGCNTCK